MSFFYYFLFFFKVNFGVFLHNRVATLLQPSEYDQGGWTWSYNPLSLIRYKNFIACAKAIIYVLVYFLLVNLST